MKIKDVEGWKKARENNQDEYGKAILDYAESWANLMEKEMESGKKLEDIATSTGSEADTEGITGFMYGAAVSMLAQAWEHGEELRIWHNLSLQIGNEGELANAKGTVLNPALLNMGVKESK
jgi:hypothetical protein